MTKATVTYVPGMTVQLDNDLIVQLNSYNKGWWNVTEHKTDGLVSIYSEPFSIRTKQIVSIVAENAKSAKNMAQTLTRYAESYEDCVSASNRMSKCNGDDVAHLLTGLEPKIVMATAESVLDLTPGSLEVKYNHLNLGQQRMCAGNMLRGAVRKNLITVDEIKAALT